MVYLGDIWGHHTYLWIMLMFPAVPLAFPIPRPCGSPGTKDDGGRTRYEPTLGIRNRANSDYFTYGSFVSEAIENNPDFRVFSPLAAVL